MKQATRPRDVARAFLRAVSPFVATCPAIKRPSNSSSKQPSRVPNAPRAVLPGGNNTAKVCQKTTILTGFLPAARRSASRKVIEKKDTIH